MPAVAVAAELPPLLDLTDENITANTIIINNQTHDRRLKYVLERLVTHLHDFARETRLSSEEWMAAIEFLTACGKICSDTRQEFILLSDALGLSCLVDVMDHPKPENATPGTVLGPFHSHEALEFVNGESICPPDKGEQCIVICTVSDTKGRPIENALVDIWETDETGHYDVQYDVRDGPKCRGLLHSDKDGKFWFKAIRPVSYPIPHDGPVGQLLEKLNRHPFRPSHMHFKFICEGYDELVTSLYCKGDPYETTDAVFGVKSPLIIELDTVKSAEMAKMYGVEIGDWVMRYDFVLTSQEEVAALKQQKASEALAKLGVTREVVAGLPIADLD
ncbi:Intradiol ring-cleavage dioxygenase [Limtongia smithiae]|uniref:Intradiol ring-cleavage dioxygenase n=1 Tax=Limtongia smithiae TaxID=1125753 RepID=UPI0034CDE9FC